MLRKRTQSNFLEPAFEASPSSNNTLFISSSNIDYASWNEHVCTARSKLRTFLHDKVVGFRSWGTNEMRTSEKSGAPTQPYFPARLWVPWKSGSQHCSLDLSDCDWTYDRGTKQKCLVSMWWFTNYYFLVLRVFVYRRPGQGLGAVSEQSEPLKSHSACALSPAPACSWNQKSVSRLSLWFTSTIGDFKSSFHDYEPELRLAKNVHREDTILPGTEQL